MLEGWGGMAEEGWRGKNWENCNNIINKNILKRKKRF